MEDYFSHSLWTFWIYCDDIRSHECTCSFPAYGEWYVLRFSWYLHYSLPGWYFNLLEDLARGAWQTCSSGTVSTPRIWSLRKIRKAQFRPESSGIFGLCCIITWYCYGPHEGTSQFRMANTPFSAWCTMFSRVCKFLSKIYSKVVLPLTQLTHKDQPFIWSSYAAEAFQSLIRAFTTAPIYNARSRRIRFCTRECPLKD